MNFYENICVVFLNFVKKKSNWQDKFWQESKNFAKAKFYAIRLNQKLSNTNNGSIVNKMINAENNGKIKNAFFRECKTLRDSAVTS